jgi:hypothetical protein
MATMPAGTLLVVDFEVGIPLYELHKLVCPWTKDAPTRHAPAISLQKSWGKLAN